MSGIRGGHVRALEAMGVLSRLRAQSRAFATTPEAIAHARACLAGAGVLADHDDAESGRAPAHIAAPSKR